MPYVIPTYTHWPLTIADATDVAAGVMSAADKSKLDSLAETVFIFRPGGVDSENVYTDWATLYAATQNVQGDFTIQVDSSLAPTAVPVGTWDMRSRATISPITPSAGSPPDPSNFTNRLDLDDGAILRDVAAFRGPVALYTNNTSGPALEITGNTLTILTEGAHVFHQGTQPVVSVTTPGQSVVFFINFSAGFDSPTNAPFIFVGGGIQCIFLTNNNVNFNSTNFATGDPAAFLFFLYDASITPPPCPGFLGTLFSSPSDQAQNIYFNDFSVFPPLGSDNVQGAIDALKSAVGATSTLSSSYLAGTGPADATLVLDVTRQGLVLQENFIPPFLTTPLLSVVTNTGTPTLNVVGDSYPGLAYSTGRGGIGVFGHAPCGQVYAGAGVGTIIPGSGTTVTDDMRFVGSLGPSGYTIGEIVTALKLFGWIQE